MYFFHSTDAPKEVNCFGLCNPLVSMRCVSPSAHLQKIGPFYNIQPPKPALEFKLQRLVISMPEITGSDRVSQNGDPRTLELINKKTFLQLYLVSSIPKGKTFVKSYVTRGLKSNIYILQQEVLLSLENLETTGPSLRIFSLRPGLHLLVLPGQLWQ